MMKLAALIAALMGVAGISIGTLSAPSTSAPPRMSIVEPASTLETLSSADFEAEASLPEPIGGCPRGSIPFGD